MANLSNINNKFIVASDGKVGIGTTVLNTISGTNPTLTLGGTGISGGLILQKAGTDTARLYENAGNMVHQGMTGVGHHFYVNAATQAMVIDTSANATFAGEVTLSAETQYLNFKKASTADVLASIISETDAGTGGKIRILTKRNGDTAINALTINDNQNVGIGTISPDSILHVESNGSTSANFILESTHSSGIPLLDLKGASSAQLRYKDSSDVIQARIDFDNSGTFNFIDVPNNSSTLYLKTGGNVGIGETSPATKLDVRGTDNGDTVRISNTGTYGGTIAFTQGSGDTNIGYIGSLRALEGNGSGDNGVGLYSRNRISFYTNSATPDVTISDNGNVLIGGGSAYLGTGVTSLTVNNDSYPTLALGSLSANRFAIIAYNTYNLFASSNNFVFDSGKVGIGTTSPGAPLHVNKADAETQLIISRSGSNLGTSTTIGNIKFQSAYNSNLIDYAYIYASSNNLSGVRGSLNFSVKSTSGSVINGMTLYGSNDGARLGIGTTTPDFALDIEAVDSGVQLQIGRTNTSAGSTWMGSDSSGFHLGVGAYGVGNSVSDPNGFIVSTSGSMLLGFTVFSSLGTANHGVGQEPEGRVTVARGSNGQAVRFYNSTGFAGDITLSGASTSYNTSSDYRLKENVVEMTGALDRVSQLKPSRFNFIANADKTVDGFLAHEVQDIVPEAITGKKDAVDEEGNPEYQGIDQSKLVPLLVGAIQELKANNDSLKARIETLENK